MNYKISGEFFCSVSHLNIQFSVSNFGEKYDSTMSIVEHSLRQFIDDLWHVTA